MPRSINGYIIGPTLGKGGFSKVKLGTHEESGERVALKLLPTTLTSSTRKQVTAEVTAMQKVQHPNVIRLHDVNWDISYPTKNGKEKTVILTVLDYAPSGELFDFLAMTGSFEEALARTYFHQLINGVGFCHEKGVVHRDLKPENLLLDESFTLKLADFGFAALKLNDDHKQSTECGTPGYMGPEMAKGAYDPVLTDIWACGVILFIMLSGFPPFQKADHTDWWFDKLKSNRHHLFWRAHSRTVNFSPEVMDLINKMLAPEPSQRISIADIKKHPWFCGPIISQTTLQKELSRRNEKVNAEKMRERMAKAAQHNSQGVSISAQTVRSIGQEMMDPACEDLPPAMENFVSAKLEDPSLGDMDMMMAEPKDYGKAEVADASILQTNVTRFASRAPPAELYSHLKAVVGTIDRNAAEKDSSYKIKFAFSVGDAKVHMVAQVFSDPTDASLFHMVLQRLSGPGLAFRGLFVAISDKFKAFIEEEETQDEQKE
mmetsp:Transcript_16594/g.23308  ORF Transcript_16594/g.23308 Transcript_16594/m.23308 type:complete len:488 (+) Transcript_16594:53-1516(+)|eukprot:CAMPEP_0175097440 /NCGR_PEP_ID=MMETSP0086_2-20121207/5288_1 /TAXON_ID=136419 /ORGANISM="Unknown Unknown, Strain D1" /LENGTH=487 /DNA_ID=CAMNT_0016370951 /DNA_START=53 /DNA_END=1516 /DNA_ORIENTATION=-